jgi:pyrroloquinoline quinone (PQQ) biosynthesis protein C
MRDEILGLYNTFPFERHPLWVGILEGKFSKQQVLAAEIQHYHRSNIGRLYRERAAIAAREYGGELYKLLLETASDECRDDKTGPSHVDLIKQFLNENGVSDPEIENAEVTSANAMAIATYKDIADRGPLHHMLGAGAVEWHYSKLCPKIVTAYRDIYGFKEGSYKTYELHGPMDEVHGDRALSLLDSHHAQAIMPSLKLAVRDAFAATSMHYDGMLQAAIQSTVYWNGK